MLRDYGVGVHVCIYKGVPDAVHASEVNCIVYCALYTLCTV